MPDVCACELLRTAHQLEAFRPTWLPLWKADANATPFQHPAWLLPWWYQFGNSNLRAAVVSYRGEPMAFLPFYVYRSPQTDQRQLLLLGAGTSDYLDGIFSPRCSPAHIRTAIRLLQQEGGWDMLYATQLRRSSPLFHALQQEPAAQAISSAHCSRMPSVRISELPVKIRRNVMYYRNRAVRRGQMQFLTATSSDCLTFLENFIRLHTIRWQSRGQSGVLADPRVLAWHREAVPLLAAKGLLRLSALRLNGEDIAIAYSLIDPPSRPRCALYIYLTAYSPEHADLRPGNILLASVIESAAEEGIQIIDMLRGEEVYKKIWHTEPVDTFGFSVPHETHQALVA